MAFEIKTNVLQVSNVLVRDIGVSVPGSGGVVTLTDIRDLDAARLSRDLVTLANDNAYGAASSTLIIYDDDRAIPQDFSEKEIREASLENTIHKLMLTQISSTGVLQGGVLSKNVDVSKFDISDGYGRVVNSYTDPRNVEYDLVNWSNKTAIPVLNLATADYSYILIDINGDVLQQTSLPTADQLRDYIYLGALIHSTRVVISSVVNNQILGYDPSLSFVDFANSFGPFNIDGNIFYANGSNLSINRSSGKIFKYGANYAHSSKSPNIVNTNSVTGIRFIYDYQTAPNVWSNTAPTTVIDPNKYDTGFGLTGVSDGYWSVQPIFLFAENEAVQIEYGQAQYPTKPEALLSVGAPFNVAPQFNSAVFRGWLAVAKGTTGLDSADYAEFVPAGKLGLVSSTSGGGGGGELTTASNAGYRGLGWYLQKTGSDLEFKNIYAASNKITITETPAQRSIDLDVSPAHIDHDTLGNILGGETGYHYHISTSEYTWIHNNPTGIRGYTGAQGLTGIAGYTGLQGITGFIGATGIQGDTGVQGDTGIQGDTGVQGITGIKGVTGVVGITGYPGVTGYRGITGAQGYTGVAGGTGIQGAQGFTGIQGLVGLTGAQGQGIANGGVTGQFLAKFGAVSYATEWRNITPQDAGADPAGTAAALEPRIANALSSGLLTGGNITINANPALFNIAAGVGLCVNNTSTPSYTPISWNDFTGVLSPYLATDDTTYIAIDATGSIVMQPEYFDNEQLSDLISLGWIDHTNRTSITYHLTEPYMASNVGVQLHTFFEAFGAFNIYGNDYYAGESGLTLTKSAGSTFDNGSNYSNSIKNPNILDNSGETGVNFRYYYRTAPETWENDGPIVNTLDPNNYDTGVGLTGVPSGKYTIQTISYYAPNAFTDISYGQAVYDTITAAGAAINIPVEINPYNSYDTFRAWLIMQQGATGMASAEQVAVVNAGRYGLLSGRYGNVSTGEANTASNVGLGGVGLFAEKSGIDLHFKNINSGSNKITVVNDIPNKTVNLDVVPANIAHNTLGTIQGGESGSRYHLSDVEYNWIHANPTGVQGATGAQGLAGVTGTGSTGIQGVTGGASADDVIGVVVDGAGSAITTGSKGFRVMNGNWTITDWTLLGKETGSCVINVKKGNYADYPFTTGIAGTQKPTLTNQIKNQSSSLSSWYTSLNDGDIVEFVVDSSSIVTKIILSISVSKG